MKRISAVIAASVLSMLACTGVDAQTKYYSRSLVAPKKAAAATTTPPSTTASCSLSSGRILWGFGSGSYTALGDVSVAFNGTDAQAGAMIKAHCESFKETNTCEGFMPTSTTLRMRAFKASAAEYVTNNSRVFPYAGSCTPAG